MRSQYWVQIVGKAVSQSIGINQPNNAPNRWEDTQALLQEGKTLGIRYDP